MILSDISIRHLRESGSIVITPAPKDHQLQPASVDLRLGGEFLSPYSDGPIYALSGAYALVPGECILATTLERIELSGDLVARVEGKSTWGRRFLMVHSTAGFIDPGFKGQITLELTNLSKVSILLPVGCLIAQISFQRTDRKVCRPYGSEGLASRYQNQVGPTAPAEP